VAHDDSLSDSRKYAQTMSRPDAAEWEVACKVQRRVFGGVRVLVKEESCLVGGGG
jgi:hypothetical protein